MPNRLHSTRLTSRRTSIPPLDPPSYAPSTARPVRAKVRTLAADTRVEPHQHPWAQVAMSATGVIRMSTPASTYLVPPSRALWIPPGVEHVVTVVEEAEMHTLYVHESALRSGLGMRQDDPALWRDCRVLEVSKLLRELVAQLPAEPGDAPATEREHCLSALVLDELHRARPVRLGIDLPSDKRLRALCSAVIDDPTRWTTLEEWARDAGASPRTVARLFRKELGTSFVQWRQQVLLARALTLAARKLPMARIAAELGYASASAFAAMVRRSVGVPPTQFFA